MKNVKIPFIIDVEASGFGPDSYPIEIGLALPDNDRYCSLIRPCDTWVHWNDDAQAVHGITREILMKSGKPFQEVALELNELLGSVTVYSDGWVVDKPWIRKLFDQACIVQTFHISPLEMILSEVQMQIWHKTKEEIIKKSSFRRHRASADAFIIQETYRRTYIETMVR